MAVSQGAQRWTYEHDERGRVETVETAVGQQFAYAYDDADRLAGAVLPGGTAYAFGYDGTGLPTEVDMPRVEHLG